LRCARASEQAKKGGRKKRKEQQQQKDGDQEDGRMEAKSKLARSAGAGARSVKRGMRGSSLADPEQ